MSTPSSSAPHSPQLVYVGVYGKSIQAFHFDNTTGTLKPVGAVGDVVNPSWLTTDKAGKYLYAVSELEGTAEGGVAAYKVDRATGKLQPLNHLPSGGVAPCFAAVDHTDKALLVANYMTGEVSAFPLAEDGSLRPRSAHMGAAGSGPNKERQEGPHAHASVLSPDNQRVYVADLGLDQIRVYKLDPATAKLTENQPPSAKGEGGLGPRHLVFDKSGDHLYLLNELKPVLSVYAHDKKTGALKLLSTAPTIPPDFKGENSGAEIRIAPSGKFLYASNRGADTIQVFAIEDGGKSVRKVQDMPTGGKVPRGFALDPSGRFLIVGNQESNSLVVLAVDEATGKLSATGKQYEIGAPVDILFLP